MRKPSLILTILVLAGGLAVGGWKVAEWRTAAAAKAVIQAAADATVRQQRFQRQIEEVGYYRVQAAYVVKDTGERIAFDYVAACATFLTMYRDGDRSIDTPFGIAPKSMVLPTRDGHAIQVVTPKACHHEVEQGWIPPDLMPLTIWHDDVDHLAFGWGYLSQDAYDNARSRMDFEGASVTAATYADFQAWHAKAEVGFKPVGQIASPWGFSQHRGVVNPVSEHCDFYVRVPVFPAGRPALTAEWERRGKPEFWVYGDDWKQPDFWDVFKGAGHIFSNVIPRTKTGGVGTIGEYATVRSDKAHYNKDVVFTPNEVYPYLPISLASTPPPTLGSTVFPTRLPVSDDWKGMAACGRNDPRLDEVFHLIRGGFFDRSPGYIEGAVIDTGRAGEPIGDRKRPFMVNDTVVRDLAKKPYNKPMFVFQRDEFTLAEAGNVIEGL